jgi:hypothetical protein
MIGSEGRRAGYLKEGAKMQARWLLCGLLGLVATCPTAQAGVYVLDKPDPWPLPENPRAFLLQHREVINRRAGEEIVERLEARRKKGNLSIEDSISLGGTYLRLRDYPKAIGILTPALAREPKNFMLLANSASAYQGINEYRRAAEFQKQVLSNWPSRRTGWAPEQLWWYRRVEKYQLTLLETRSRAKLLNKPETTLDDLFPVNPFASGSAKYLVGEIDLKARDRLPPDVFPLVEQLLLWMPHDNRLRWLFAELLNARGEVAEAVKIFNELPNPPYDFSNADATFWKHRKALNEAIETDPRFKPAKEPGPEMPADLGNPKSTAGTGQNPVSPPAPAAPAAPEKGTTQQKWLPDWRQLAVGFGTGLIVGMLLLLQFRQLSRRFSSRSQQRPAPT